MLTVNHKFNQRLAPVIFVVFVLGMIGVALVALFGQRSRGFFRPRFGLGDTGFRSGADRSRSLTRNRGRQRRGA